MSRPFVDPTLLYPVLRAGCLALSSVCLLWTGMPVALAQQSVQVRSQDGLLSVQASNASAIELAEVLSNQLGISVVVTGDTEALVNIDIVDEPLEKALAKLSPNHMLVRSSKQSDSEITEVVLMMGEGSSSDSSSDISSGGDDQFLPSGSPAEDVATAVEEEPVDDINSRDPNRSAMVREAADAASSDSTGLSPENSGGAPPPDSFDPVTGLPIDPVTGLPQE